MKAFSFIKIYLCATLSFNLLGGGACSSLCGTKNVTTVNTTNINITNIQVGDVKQSQEHKAVARTLIIGNGQSRRPSSHSKTKRKGSKPKELIGLPVPSGIGGLSPASSRGLKMPKDADILELAEMNILIANSLKKLFPVALLTVISDYANGDCGPDKYERIKKCSPDDFILLLIEQGKQLFHYLPVRDDKGGFAFKQSDNLSDVRSDLNDPVAKVKNLARYERVCKNRVAKLEALLKANVNNGHLPIVEQFEKEKIKTEQKLRLIKLLQCYERIQKLEKQVEHETFKGYRTRWLAGKEWGQELQVHDEFVTQASDIKRECADKYAALLAELVNENYLQEADKKALAEVVEDKKKKFNTDVTTHCTQDWSLLMDINKKLRKNRLHVRGADSHSDIKVRLARASERFNSTHWLGATPGTTLRTLDSQVETDVTLEDIL